MLQFGENWFRLGVLSTVLSMGLGACGGGSSAQQPARATDPVAAPDITLNTIPETTEPAPAPAPYSPPENSGPVPGPITTSPFVCTQVIGFSQTSQWFYGLVDPAANLSDPVPLGGFQAVIDNHHWQLLWQGGAGIEEWSNPGFSGWNGEVKEPCRQKANSPDRVLLTISGDLGMAFRIIDPQVWADEIDRAVTTIVSKYPGVLQVILQPVVGGPDDAICISSEGGEVRASANHPVIDEAIAIVARSSSSPVEVVVGFSPNVTDCSDYLDKLGHLTDNGKDAVGRIIGAFYNSR